MDNNEAREMDYADNATGPDHAHTLYQCEGECDLPIHHDRKLSPWQKISIAANPNRPTPQGYCAQGAHARSYHFQSDGACHAFALPRTAFDQGVLNRAATLDALTPEQMRTALMYLSSNDVYDGGADPRWTNAIAYALNPR